MKEASFDGPIMLLYPTIYRVYKVFIDEPSTLIFYPPSVDAFRSKYIHLKESNSWPWFLEGEYLQISCTFCFSNVDWRSVQICGLVAFDSLTKVSQMQCRKISCTGICYRMKIKRTILETEVRFACLQNASEAGGSSVPSLVAAAKWKMFVGTGTVESIFIQ